LKRVATSSSSEPEQRDKPVHSRRQTKAQQPSTRLQYASRVQAARPWSPPSIRPTRRSPKAPRSSQAPWSSTYRSAGDTKSKSLRRNRGALGPVARSDVQAAQWRVRARRTRGTRRPARSDAPHSRVRSSRTKTNRVRCQHRCRTERDRAGIQIRPLLERSATGTALAGPNTLRSSRSDDHPAIRDDLPSLPSPPCTASLSVDSWGRASRR